MDVRQYRRDGLHGTNPIERRNGEIVRHTDDAGIFPGAAAITRRIDAIVPEQSDARATQRAGTMTLETIGSVNDNPRPACPPQPDDTAARPTGGHILRHAVGHDGRLW